MKTHITHSLLAAAAACSLANAQTTAYTTPVGYITHTVAPAGANPAAETYLSASLVEPNVYAGVTLSATANTLNFSGTSVPATLDATYVLEITSGPSEGWWSTVISSTSSTIVLNDNFPIATPTAVSVRKHSTLQTFLGNNTPGFVTFNGIDPSDEVQVWDPITQGTIPFAYISGPDLADPNYPDGAWWDLGNSAIANDYPIVPGSSVRIKRIGNQLTFTSTGTVKTTKTQVDLYINYNWIGTPLAVGGTLDAMSFNTQLIQFDGVSENFDELTFLDPDQSARPFAAIDGAPPTMYDLGNSVEAGSEPFAGGTGVIIRRIGNPSGTVTLPGSIVNP
jgi:hypothetical protein